MISELKQELEEGEKLLLQFEKRGGLLPVIVQEHSSGQVLMLGYANQEAFEKTLESGKATFWSTSRNKLWTKGETSGDYLEMIDILVDCDQDAIVYQVRLAGEGVCHTYDKAGKHRKACFYRSYESGKKRLQFLKEME